MVRPVTHDLPILRELVMLAGCSLAIILLFRKFKLPPVVGFLVTGILLGPGGFGLVKDPATISTLAEIGVVLLLFTVGLEFSIADLKKLGLRAAAAGLLQVVGTAAVVALVSFMFVLHGLLAMRKFPANFQEYKSFASHRQMLRHEDTTLWWVQAWTGFALFFLASVHLYQMLMHPGDIGPYESADRVWSGNWWPLYLVLLFAVELHGGVGLYRLAVKWGWFEGEDPKRTRTMLKRLKWAITVFFLALGLLTLAAYMKLGHERRDRVGERYVPSYAEPSGSPAQQH